MPGPRGPKVSSPPRRTGCGSATCRRRHCRSGCCRCGSRSNRGRPSGCACSRACCPPRLWAAPVHERGDRRPHPELAGRYRDGAPHAGRAPRRRARRADHPRRTLGHAAGRAGGRRRRAALSEAAGGAAPAGPGAGGRARRRGDPAAELHRVRAGGLAMARGPPDRLRHRRARAAPHRCAAAARSAPAPGGRVRGAADAARRERWRHGARVDAAALWTLRDDAGLDAEIAQLLADAGVAADSRLVGLHLGAAFGSSKLWPAEAFGRLAQGLAAAGLAPVLLGHRATTRTPPPRSPEPPAARSRRSSGATGPRCCRACSCACAAS